MNRLTDFDRAQNEQENVNTCKSVHFLSLEITCAIIVTKDLNNE